MADISTIILPNGETYNIKDTTARENIPTKTSDLTNDSGFLTSYTETDPTVPAWAKASSKPTYTASEVGAVPLTSSSAGGQGSISNAPGLITIQEGDSGGLGSASLTMNGSTVTLTALKDLVNTSIKLKTNNVENIYLSEGQTTITGVVTPTSDTMAANKKYVDDAIAGIVDTNTIYSLSISNNRITLTPSSGTASYIDLPVYNGGVT